MITLLLIAACGSEDPADSTETDTTLTSSGGTSGGSTSGGTSGSGTSGGTSGSGTSGGTSGGTTSCPAFVEGQNTGFPVGDDLRDFQLRLPAEPDGAPVVLAWHWLGGSGTQVINQMDLDLAVDAGAIVVAPESSGDAAYEWFFVSSADDNPDLDLLDGLLSCLTEHYDVDPDRLYATGMSAGGMWTSYLTLHRAEVFAATAPLSGGALEHAYATPAAQLPVMLIWGGEDDTYGSFSFDDSTRYLSGALQDDGHLVIECMHQGGHTIPQQAGETVWTFFADHVRGAQSPYESSDLPSPLSDWCAVAG